MEDKELLNKIVVEIAKLGFIATFDDTAIVISKNRGKYVQPLFVWVPKVKEADYIVTNSAYGNDFKEVIDTFIKLDPASKQSFLARFIEDNDLSVEMALCVYVSDPSSNNECVMLNLTGDNYCDANGKHIAMYEQYKSPEIRDIINTCMSRVINEAGGI